MIAKFANSICFVFLASCEHVAGPLLKQKTMNEIHFLQAL